MNYKFHSASQDEAKLALLTASPSALELPEPGKAKHWLGETSLLQRSAAQMESPNSEAWDGALGPALHHQQYPTGQLKAFLCLSTVLQAMGQCPLMWGAAGGPTTARVECTHLHPVPKALCHALPHTVSILPTHN